MYPSVTLTYVFLQLEIGKKNCVFVYSSIFRCMAVNLLIFSRCHLRKTVLLLQCIPLFAELYADVCVCLVFRDGVSVKFTYLLCILLNF